VDCVELFIQLIYRFMHDDWVWCTYERTSMDCRSSTNRSLWSFIGA